MMNYAHRGASGYRPENTLDAFRMAIEIGANGIETDIQMTSDGKLVLIHDETLDRTTNGKGLVKDYSLSQIKQLDAGNWFDPRFKGEKVPLLEELFVLVQSGDIYLNLELKNSVYAYPGLEEATIRMIRQYGFVNRTVISSFNPQSLVKCKKLAPEIRTGFLYHENIYQPWVYAQRLKVNGLHPAKNRITTTLIEHAHRNNLQVIPWTVNNPIQMKRLIQDGVDGVITNYPDRLKFI